MKLQQAGPAVRFRVAPKAFRTLLADARATERTLNSAFGNRRAAAGVGPAQKAGGGAAMGPLVKPAVVKTAVATTAATLASARHGAHQHAEALVDERRQAVAARRERLDARQIELICRELLGPDDGPAPAAQVVPLPPVVPPHESWRAGGTAEADASRLASARTRAALELARRIEIFLGARGPALELPLPEALGAAVIIERVGPNAVALTLRGRRGPPCPEAVGHIRAALRARGLSLGALTVG